MISGTAEPNSIVTIYDRGVPVAVGTADAFGNFAIGASLLADGQHTFTAKATDGAGNTGPASNTEPVKIDTLPPSAPTITSLGTDTGVQGDGLTADNTLTLTGTAVPGSLVSVYEGAPLVGPVVAGPTGAWSLVTPPLADGTHTYTAKLTQPTNGTSLASAALAAATASSTSAAVQAGTAPRRRSS